MRKYKFEEFQKELKKRYYANFSSLAPERLPARRKRKQEDLDILLEMMIARKKRWLKTGKLVDLGPRKYILAIDNICVCEKPKAKVVKSGKAFSKYIKAITRSK